MGKKKAHIHHLCSLKGCDDIAEIAPLVVEPRYLCGRCGRAARKKKNLSQAKKLSAYLGQGK